MEKEETGGQYRNGYSFRFLNCKFILGRVRNRFSHIIKKAFAISTIPIEKTHFSDIMSVLSDVVVIWVQGRRMQRLSNANQHSFTG